MKQRHSLLALPLVASLGLAALAGAPAAQKLSEDMVIGVRCPDDGIQPRFVLDDEALLHLLYFKGDLEAGDLYYVTSDDYAKTFGEPIRVNTVRGTVDATNGVRGGRLAVGDSGRVHVVWFGTEGAEAAFAAMGDGDAEETSPGEGDEIEEAGSRNFFYTRLREEGDRFERPRTLIDDPIELDAVPTLIDGHGQVIVAWHSLGMVASENAEAEVEAGDGELVRQIYYRISENQGRSFGDVQVAETGKYGVSEFCSMAGATQEDGTLFIVYQSKSGHTRDMRMLVSVDRGGLFRSKAVDNWRYQKDVNTACSIGTGEKFLLTAYESHNKVYFTRIDPRRRQTLVPYQPREPKVKEAGAKPAWRGRPSAAGNQFKTGLIAWVEGDTKGVGERIVWQGFYFPERRNVGMGRFHEIPSGTVPAVLVRPDQSFVILY